MKSVKNILPILSTALLMTACGQTAVLPNSASSPALVQTYQAPANIGQIAVRFRQDASRTALGQFNSRYGLRTVNYHPQLNIYLMEPVNPRVNISSLIRTMGQDPAVVFAEINQEIKVTPVVDMQVKPIFNY
ncbi:hypothetical protein COW36_08195 [bacterium (Candidatus Blackallbacteria) CG17_big_fil_post_rev_8_21_14_2_50_48_46]|uniref:Fervidolysin-like N-terminal prodomain domain-containing protein n=1 Tax=bacterium (Candidatus Blackallbacteria) CG17_big_fil_post_rev_8_21_14_2_50_48_46 TaxID=2014261 RepID=A0A2M7G615_9BACT|nr:MAG: hypothetical protein COW64_24735 [bacterium (Candidatus Blackallbacteria) CG18_big_fil_WC_8_21_14_2_50_49_26]PIW17470.1 MAG: hypothetical protein COW36_08195 [bacterium (Candidatus Blackallbacteria) CG17_big_fil_post_rev_8_21_14_2_50_48_46]PIW48324.1 MAG: hypothetical protein COW20_09550 [bacterium (Candidatus Blackallbacteria) CG13_big_fil_rev_8_21_14_2_50_49_14]